MKKLNFNSKIYILIFLLFLILPPAFSSSYGIETGTEKVLNKAISSNDFLYGSLTEEIKIQNNFLKNLGTNEIKIGSYLMNVKKLDLSSGSWTADFYVWYVWKNDDMTPKFEVMNGTLDSKEKLVIDTIEVEGETYHWFTYRFPATLSNNFNFRHYPLDIQTLTLEMEDSDLDRSKMKYTVFDRECLIDQNVKIAGWDIIEKFTKIDEHNYPTAFGYAGNNVYSRFVFGIKIVRPRFSALLKILLPLAIILSLSLITFALTPDKFSQRISLGISTVFTSVAFHINLTSSIPQVSYLTLVDRVMISAYFLLFMSLIATIYLVRYIDSGDIEYAKSLNKKLAVFVILTGITIIALQFTF